MTVGAGIWLAVRATRGPEISSTTPRLSIVVLPFANLSGDPTHDYLADALTEELTTSLSRRSGAFVIACSTAFTYKGKPADVKQTNSTEATRVVKVNPAFRTSKCTCSGGYELSDRTSMYSGIFVGSPLFECTLRWKVRAPRNVSPTLPSGALNGDFCGLLARKCESNQWGAMTNRL